MAKFTRLKNDAKAERDFYMTVTKRKGVGVGEKTAPRSIAYYHHTATAIGYISVKDAVVINYYRGKFGEGFVVYKRNDRYPSLSYKSYYIFREYLKDYRDRG